MGLERVLGALARLAGYDLVPRHKQRVAMAQLVAGLARARVDLVVDAGANRGQWAASLRAAGWRGAILSIEPQAELHPALERAAGHDRTWRIAPAMALADRDGDAIFEVSAENDMSSLNPQTSRLQALSPSSAIAERRLVPVRRLDGLLELGGAQRIFVKLDLQGGERAAIEGAAALWPRIAGLQVEMALLPLYDGEADWRSTIDGLAVLGFELHLLVPGYFERKLTRQVQVDGVFFRSDPEPPDAAAAAESR